MESELEHDSPKGYGGKTLNDHFNGSFLDTLIPQATSTVNRQKTISMLPVTVTTNPQSDIVMSQLGPEERIAHAIDQKQALSRKLEILRSNANNTFWPPRQSDQASEVSSLGLVDVDSMEDFPDETKYIEKMLQRSPSPSFSSLPNADSVLNSSNTSKKSSADAKDEQRLYIAADLIARKERALALEVMQQMDKSSKPSSIHSHFLHPNESSRYFYSQADVPTSLLDTSSFDVSQVISPQKNSDPFSQTFNGNGTIVDSFSGEVFRPADSTQAIAQLRAGDEEVARAHEILPQTSESILPNMSQENKSEITVNTTPSTNQVEGPSKIPVEDFFLKRSENMGSLDSKGNMSSRPSFGCEIVSPQKGVLTNTDSIRGVTQDVVELNDSDSENTDPSKPRTNADRQSVKSRSSRRSIGLERILQDVSKKSLNDRKVSDVTASSVCFTPLSGSLLSWNNSGDETDHLDMNIKDSLSSGWLIVHDEHPINCNSDQIEEEPCRDRDDLIDLCTETGGENVLDFGLMPECSSEQLFITLHNRSDADLPIHIVIKNISRYCAFSIDDDSVINESDLSDQSEQRSFLYFYKIGAKEKLRLLITCCTTTLQNLGMSQSNKTVDLTGILSVHLDTPDHEQVKSVILRSRVGFTRLSFHAATIPLLTLKCELGRSVTHPFLMRNDGFVPLKLAVEVVTLDEGPVENDVFSVDKSRVDIQPGEETSVKLTFTPRNELTKFIDLRLVITVQPNGYIHESDILCVTTMALASSRSSSRSSNTASTASKSSADGSEDGTLNIKSTQTNLSWSSTALGKAEVKTFTIKNYSMHTSKIMARIVDPSHSFKFKNEQGDIVDIRALRLNSNECCKLSVIFNPSKVGAFLGFIKFSSSALSSSVQSVKLNGYGGNGQLNVEGIPKDSGGRMWLNLGVCGNTRAQMQARFRVHNKGNLAIFSLFKIFAKSLQPFSDSVLSVQPPGIVLAPGSASVVRVLYQPQQGHHMWNNRDVAELATLQIITGDEPTRFRLREHLRRFPYSRDSLSQTFGINLEELAGDIFGEEAITDVNILCDPEAVGRSFCRSLILKEVPVIVERDINETLHVNMSMSCLDSTSRFFQTLYGDCDAENANYTRVNELSSGASSWSVHPLELTFLLPTNKCQDIWIENFSTKEQLFEVEVVGEKVKVHPSGGAVPAEGKTVLKVFSTALPTGGQLPAEIKILMKNDMKVVRVLTELGKRPIVQNRSSEHGEKQFQGNAKYQRFETSTPSLPKSTSQLNKPGNHSPESVITGSTVSSIEKHTSDSLEELRCDLKKRFLESLHINRNQQAKKSSHEELSGHDDGVETPLHPGTATNAAMQRDKVEDACLTSKVTPGLAQHGSMAQSHTIKLRNDTGKSIPSLKLGPFNLSKEVPISISTTSYEILFPSTTVNEYSRSKITLKNSLAQQYKVNIRDCNTPFYIPSTLYIIKEKAFLTFKVYFRPVSAGNFQQFVIFEPEIGSPIKVLLSGLGILPSPENQIL